MSWTYGDLLPHAICLVDPLLIWLHAVADAVTGLSYLTIPVALFYFAARRRDVGGVGMAVLFGAFVLACGTTHLLGLITLWQPIYWVEGLAKGLTAVVSLATAVAVWPFVKRAVHWPSPDQLRLLNETLEQRVMERTAEVLAEKERRVESEARFRAAQEASLDAFVILEPVRRDGRTVDLRFLYANRKAAEYCRAVPGSMEGRLVSEVIPGSTAPGGLIERQAIVADSGKPLEYVLDYDADGIKASFRNLVVAFDGLVAVTFRDITAQVAAERALKQAKQDAEHANEAKSRFLAAASHDLRQPLQALNLYLGVLGQRLQPGAAHIMRHIDICVANLSELLTDLLDLSKLDAGVVEPKQADFPLSEALDHVFTAHAAAAQQKGIRLRVVPTRLHARTDKVLFERIVANLASNALRYTTEGGVVIGVRRRRGRVWLEITDSGIGIAKDKQDVIFEEFRQLANPERSREKGSGLGLAIVRKAARLLGLEVRVSSVPGKGSTFAVEVPLGRPVATEESRPVARRAGMLIGLVEDDPQVREALRFALEGEGHLVIPAANRFELLERLRGQRPDAMVADYRLAHGETGLDAVAAVRAECGAEVPAVILTGETGEAVVGEIARSGLKVLHKPVRFHDLQRCLAEIG